ncbi:MAG: sulfotransferase, partial [Acidimicrobiia bacterium]
MAIPPLPTFLIIGAQKSATRWLRHNLGRHREIYTSPYELGFFNSPKRFATLGVDWYRAQFEGWNGERIVGEA